MNVAMTYTMLPDFAVSRDQVRPAYHFPVVKKLRVSTTESGTDLTRESRNVYKYYVLSQTDDKVYTRSKVMESLYLQGRGSLVDIYA